MEEQNTKPEPRQVNFNEREFTANGKRYYISDKISIARWKEYEKLSARLTYGIDFENMQKQLTKSYAAVNEKRFADAAVSIHNILSGVKDANDESRIHPSLLMCTLLINRDGEDTGVCDKQVQLDKIADWTAEGLDILSFFSFALRSINGFRETYLLYTQALAENFQQEAKSQK